MRPICSLDDDHRLVLQRAVVNVLSTSLAQTTLAKIIDGLPLSEVERDKYNKRSISHQHPINERHKTLCPEALETLRELSDQFDLLALTAPAELLFEFNSLKAGSVAFNTRLIELVARLIHDFAAMMHDTQPKFHQNDELTNWVPSKEDNPNFWYLNPKGAPPTLLRHQQYTKYRLYQRGVADGVGYWADARILGGVVLFGRRDPKAEPEANPHDIYFHSDRCQVTYRIYALLDSQRQAPLDFLLNTNYPRHNIDEISPLPIFGTRDNRQRVDPEESTLGTGIYRDPWERKVSHPERDRRRARKDVSSGLDYITWDEFQASVRRGADAERAWLERDDNEDERPEDDE